MATVGVKGLMDS